MSAGAIGAFAQGLVKGYQVGDEMKTADTKRKYIEQQTALDAQKAELTGLQIKKAKDIEAAGSELASAVKEIMPDMNGQMPSSGAIGDPVKEMEKMGRWRSAIMNYYAVAKPEALEELRRTNKSEALTDWARGVANTTAGLMNRDSNAIAAASKLYGMVPDGFQLDPAKSGYTKDGVAFAVRNEKTGETQVVERSMQDIHKLAYRGIFDPSVILSSVDREERTAETGRHNREAERLQARGQDIQLQGIRENAAARVQAAKERTEDRTAQANDRYITGVYQQIAATSKADLDGLDSPENTLAPEQKAAKRRQIIDTMAIAQDAAKINFDNGIKLPPAVARRAAEDVLNGGVRLRPWVEDPKTGAINPMYGIHPDGFLIMYPPGAKRTK